MKTKTTAIAFLIVLMTTFTVSAQASTDSILAAKEYKQRDCLRIPRGESVVLRENRAFLENIRNDMSRKRCLSELAKIDFSEHDLVGVNINSGYCRYPLGLTFEATKSEEKKKVKLSVSYLKPDGVCRALSSYNLWVLIPKLPVDYEFGVDISARKK